MRDEERERLEALVIQLRGMASEYETWDALRKVLAAIRGQWYDARVTPFAKQVPLDLDY